MGALTPLVWFGTGGRAPVPRFGTPPWPAAARWVLPGLAAIAVLLTLTVQAGVDPTTHPPHWPAARLWARSAQHRGLLATGILLAVAGLVAAWARLHRRVAESALRWHPWAAALVWIIPLSLAPPMFSMDVYSYAAVGRLAMSGYDPFVVGPAALGGGGFLAAVDPIWRHTGTPYGPVMVAIARTAAELSGGSVLIAALLLRAVALAAVVVAVVLAVRAAAPTARTGVLVLTALNPLVLLHLVSGAHLDALVGAAAVAVVLLALRGRWCPAIALAVVAFMVKAPGAVLIGFVLLSALRSAEPGRRIRALAGIVATGAASLAVCALLVPNPFGWTHALDVPGRARDLAAPSAWLGHLLDGLARLGPFPLPTGTALAFARGLVLAVGGVLAVLLLWRGAGRSDRAGALRCVGVALLVVAVSGPALHPWYLAWGLFAVAAGSRPGERDLLVALCAVPCLLGLPSMQRAPVAVQAAGWGLLLLLWWWARPAALDRPIRRTAAPVRT